jgi:hypothetical protein
VTTTAIRLTAAERREAVLDAAMAEFAAHCWSSDEENSPQVFLTIDALYRLS